MQLRRVAPSLSSASDIAAGPDLGDRTAPDTARVSPGAAAGPGGGRTAVQQQLVGQSAGGAAGTGSGSGSGQVNVRRSINGLQIDGQQVVGQTTAQALSNVKAQNAMKGTSTTRLNQLSQNDALLGPGQVQPLPAGQGAVVVRPRVAVPVAVGVPVGVPRARW